MRLIHLVQSFTLGRPPGFTLAHIVYDQAFGAKTPTYSTVLQLDRKLRGFAVPASLQIAGFGNSESRVGSLYESVPLILQRHLVLAIREISELCQPGPHATMNRVRTNTFSAWKCFAVLVNRLQAELSWTYAEGARLIDGHLVTMEPKIICQQPQISVWQLRIAARHTEHEKR